MFSPFCSLDPQIAEPAKKKKVILIILNIVTPKTSSIDSPAFYYFKVLCETLISTNVAQLGGVFFYHVLCVTTDVSILNFADSFQMMLRKGAIYIFL